MPLKSELFRGEPRLEAAAASNPAHILKGAKGPHVRRLQRALVAIDGGEIAQDEKDGPVFGESTEQAVLRFKTTRRIINKAYQKSVDPIVGIMTMKALDEEMLALENAIGEATILCSIASALGYTPLQPKFVTDDRPLRRTVQDLQRKD